MGERRNDAELIEQHLPLVNHVVLQVAVHFPRYVDRQELARAGALGLVEAARRFDESRGVPFDRFAARRIRGAILDCVRASDWAPGRSAPSVEGSRRSNKSWRTPTGSSRRATTSLTPSACPETSFTASAIVSSARWCSPSITS